MSNSKRFGLVGLVVTAVLGAGAGIILTLAVFRPHATVDPSGPTKGSSPVKVHGGAMRVRAEKGIGPWQVETMSGTVATGYCLPYNPSQISLIELVPEVAGNPSVINSIGGSWTLVLLGSDPTQSTLSPSKNGFKLEENTSKCNGQTAPKSNYALHLTLVNYAGFYPNVKTEADGSSSVRFEDTTPGSAAVPSICAGPNGNPNGDEDACERFAQVSVKVGSTNYGNYDCQEGDNGCSVKFK